MKRTNKIKAYLARVLAAAMVITMAAPPAPPASGAGVCIELRGSGSHSV